MDEQIDLSSSLRRGTLEFCILALIEHRDLYGTELVRTLGAERSLVISEGTLYPLLSRLRRSGWVDTVWQESPSGPPRRYYSLTDSGRRALNNFRLEWAAFRDAVDRMVGRDPA
jgi:PadR family transcriptional regulator PadR